MLRLRTIVDEMHSSYWFVPGTMAAAAILLSFVTISVDQQVQYDWVSRIGFFWSGGATGARGLLSTVASSMITVAGVTFSITLVALSQASSQFGPRLLRSFMRDRANQFVLGTFVSTFIYSLLILRTVRSGSSEFVPYISVTVSVMLAVAGLLVLIFFIHHMAVAIQAPSVIANVTGELLDAIDDLFPSKVGNHGREPGQEADLPPDFDAAAFSIAAPYTGYVQVVDDRKLLRTAVEGDLVVKLLRRPGDFVVQGMPVLQVWPTNRTSDENIENLGESVIIGTHRTGTQDVEFAIEQLVEVAVRSLSPAVNDPFTAISCIDWLGAALCKLTTRDFPSPYRYDSNNRLRLIVERGLTFPGLVDTALNQIRQYAGSSVAVRVRLLEIIALVFDNSASLENREALLNQAAMIDRATPTSVPEREDRADVRERYQDVSDN